MQGNANQVDAALHHITEHINPQIFTNTVSLIPDAGFESTPMN